MVTNNISEIRKERHLSQDDLAVALGVCRKSIFNNVITNIDTCLIIRQILMYLSRILTVHCLTLIPMTWKT